MNDSIIKPPAIYGDTLSPTQYSIFDSTSDMIIQNLKSKTYDIAVLHVENTSEFYVQTPEHLKTSMQYSQKIQNILQKYEESMSPNTSFTAIEKSKVPKYKVGDLLFTKNVCDAEWYRCFVIDITQCNDTKKTDDGYNYEVYFVDYGNKQKDIKSSNFRTYEAILASKCVSEKELDDIFSLPFQAVCCEIKNKKVSFRNTETLNTLVKDCLNLKIEIRAMTK